VRPTPTKLTISSFGWTITLMTWTHYLVTPLRNGYGNSRETRKRSRLPPPFLNVVLDILDALIDDWIEVLSAHDEGFLTELR
jgi:hypothetical protein